MKSPEFQSSNIAERLSRTLDFDDDAIKPPSEKNPEHYTLELGRYDEDLLEGIKEALNMSLHLRGDAEILVNMPPDQIFDLLLKPDELVDEWEREDTLKQQNSDLSRETSQFIDKLNEVPPNPAQIRKIDGKPILLIEAAALEKIPRVESTGKEAESRIEGLEKGKEAMQKHIKLVEGILRVEQRWKEGTVPIKEHQIYKRGDRASL